MLIAGLAASTFNTDFDTTSGDQYISLTQPHGRLSTDIIRRANVTPEIQSRVVDRLVDTGKADEPWALIVLAAMEGEQALDGFLEKARTIAPPQRSESSAAAASEPPGAYVASISVEGFRGVGPAATLALRPGPGLTLMASRLAEFVQAVRTLVENAALEREKLEDVWRPIASAIEAWLPTARKAVAAKDTIKQIKSAEDWWKETSASVRDERFAPIATKARSVWSQLRLQSNVDLGGVVLEGTAGRRRVALQATVDGTPAEALGVMSQGELHSLALSLFLPRATLPESPFRFICIDDPVQSMDPARVEGLARVLADAALTRQVVVFTHDDRLPEAVRRLGLPATVHNVTRRAKSVVEVRQITDPVTTLIDDARAVAMTQDLPQDVASRVVPGFCRSAVEAGCMDAVRRRRLAKGDTHDAVEEMLTANAKLYPLIALALFDDESRTNDVMPRLKKMGQWAIDAFTVCKMGAHERHEGELKLLVDNSQRLAQSLQVMQ